MLNQCKLSGFTFNVSRVSLIYRNIKADFVAFYIVDRNDLVLAFSRKIVMSIKPKLISNIYDCAVNDSRWDEVIDTIVPYTGARGAILGAVKVSGNDIEPAWALASGSQCWRDIPPDKLEYIKKKFLPYQITFWEKLSKKDKLGSLLDNDSELDDGHLASREDYVFRREQLGIARSVGYRLNNDSGWFDTFIAHFDEEHQAVPESSKIILAELVPHLSKSVEIARTFSMLKLRYEAVLAALDHISIGICIVQPNRVVIVSNTEALRIFEESGLIRLDAQKRLISNSTQSNYLLNQAIDKANIMPTLDSADYENVFRIDSKDGQSLLVESTHLRDSSGELGDPLNCAMVSIVDLSNTSNINTGRLGNVYSLSAAEQEVSSLLVHGFTNKEIAEQRNVTPDTVKSQLASIYAKTAVRNRSELIRLALKTSPPVNMNE